MTSRQSPAALAVIRIAMLVGVLLFGAVIWFLQGRPGWAPPTPASLPTLRVAVFAAWGLAAVVLLALRVRAARPGGAARGTLSLVAWAVGEGAALMGGVYYFLSGDARWFLGGLFVMLASFLLFPVPRRA